MSDAKEVASGPGGVPAFSIDSEAPALLEAHLGVWDELREDYPVFWNELHGGHWVFTRFDNIRGVLETPAAFSTGSTILHEPDPDYLLIPLFVDPPVHGKYRQLFTGPFSPGRVNKLTPTAREICRNTIEALLERNGCDFMADFAGLFPTQVFLVALGLPVEDAPRLLQYVKDMSSGFSGVDPEAGARGRKDVRRYFEDRVKERRQDPRDPDSDMVSYFLAARIDGEPLSDTYVLSILMTLLLGGLDTTKVQLGYSLYHFATYPEDRRRIIDQPNLLPGAIEELLRFYAFAHPGRRVVQDFEYEGCPMREGQMVFAPLWSANRDPRIFEDAERVILDRPHNRHVAFGAGPHRCLGAHLARRELLVALEEWHQRIPEYWIDPEKPLPAHHWGLGFESLPLAWAT